jgi:hypothetical protein
MEDHNLYENTNMIKQLYDENRKKVSIYYKKGSR